MCLLYTYCTILVNLFNLNYLVVSVVKLYVNYEYKCYSNYYLGSFPNYSTLAVQCIANLSGSNPSCNYLSVGILGEYLGKTHCLHPHFVQVPIYLNVYVII